MSETVLPAPARSSSIWRWSSSRHLSKTLRSIACPRKAAIQNYNLSSFGGGCKACLPEVEPDRNLEPAGCGRERSGADDAAAGGLVERPGAAAAGHADLLRDSLFADADAQEHFPLLSAADRLLRVDDAGLDPLPQEADLRPFRPPLPPPAVPAGGRTASILPLPGSFASCGEVSCALPDAPAGAGTGASPPGRMTTPGDCGAGPAGDGFLINRQRGRGRETLRRRADPLPPRFVRGGGGEVFFSRGNIVRGPIDEDDLGYAGETRARRPAPNEEHAGTQDAPPPNR